MNKIRKGDTVVVLSGKDKGRQGTVLSVDGEKVLVENINKSKKHQKPNPQRNIKGGVVEREAPLHASNVQLVCPECGRPTRIGRKILGDGRKVRICRKCEGVVDK